MADMENEMAFALLVCATGGALAAWYKILVPLGRLLQLTEDLNGATGPRPQGWTVAPPVGDVIVEGSAEAAGQEQADFTKDLLALASAMGTTGTLVIENPGVKERK
jgi:hypothetical protein